MEKLERGNMVVQLYYKLSNARKLMLYFILWSNLLRSLVE